MFQEIIASFPEKPIVIGINKVDVASRDVIDQLKTRLSVIGEGVEIIATEEIGLDLLLRQIGIHLRKLDVVE